MSDPCCSDEHRKEEAPSSPAPCGPSLRTDLLRETVRVSYAQVAKASDAGQGCGIGNSCCGVDEDAQINQLISTRLGYSVQDLALAPEGADMGLGCGNPKAIAALQPGETVLDLGSGGGFDCFLAAVEVGPSGRVIGVDMTPDMIFKARCNAQKGGYAQVEFRLGEIEHLPLGDGCVDVIISNCVINLSPNKPQVFREAFRVLRPGGRLALSDTVASAELPPELKNDPQLYAGCMAGAVRVDELRGMLQAAGFERIYIQPKDESREFIRDWAPGLGVEDYVVSATIEAIKPDRPG
jgi:arsenite methyltransferase